MFEVIASSSGRVGEDLVGLVDAPHMFGFHESLLSGLEIGVVFPCCESPRLPYRSMIGLNVHAEGLVVV